MAMLGTLFDGRAMHSTRDIGTAEHRKASMSLTINPRTTSRIKMRPHVICHMISSVDGRLDLDRWTPPVAGTPDGLAFRVYEGIASRLGADAWMIGRNTMAELVTGPFANKEIVTEPLPRDTFIAYKGAGGLATVVDAHGKLEFSCNSVRTDRILTILRCGANARSGTRSARQL